MNVWNLVVREIRHRKWNFVLGLLSVAVAVACLVGSLTLLNAHEIHTEEILKKKQAEHEQALREKQSQVDRAYSDKERELAKVLKDKQTDVEESLKKKDQELAKALKDKQLAVEKAIRDKEQEVVQTLAKKKADVAKTVAAREKQVKEAGKALQDEMRKITKKLGFNLLILPGNQDLNELYTQGTLSKTMPEEYVKRLANSKIMTVNHLLPILTHKLEWDGPVKKQTIMVIGTRGEVPLMHRDAKKPLKGGEAVPKGTLVAGFEVRKQQKLKKGDKVKLLGKEFTVAKLYEQRGTVDDSTVWINLAEAQAALGKQNLVNAVLALECNCATADRLGEIRKDIARILPGTQVIESGRGKALARAEARNEAKKVAVQALQRAEQNGAALLKNEKESGDELLNNERAAGAAQITNEREANQRILDKERTDADAAITKEKAAHKQLLVNELVAGIDAVERERSQAAADRKRETENLANLQQQRKRFAAILIPLVIVGCAVWIGFLAFGNVRQRSAEIGILRAIGLRSVQILSIFLIKAILIGVIGAVVGYLAGFGLGLAWSGLPATSDTGAQLFGPGLLLLAIAMSLLLSGVASWFPAMLAARQDPAVVLQEE